jgi:TonB family protein
MKLVGLAVWLLLGCASLHGQEQGGASQAPAGASGSKEVKILAPAGTRLKAGAVVTAAKLIKRVNPAYPPLARQTRISGTVSLDAVIGKDGSVLQLKVLSGHPLLIQAALDAVRLWKYSPTLLEGEPVEVETTIDVIFSIQDGNKPPGEADRLAGAKPSQQVDPQLRADLSKLLESLQSHETMKEAMAGLRPVLFTNIHDEGERQKLLNSFEQKWIALYDSDAYREGALTTYAKYLNDDDAKALMAFYETPTGQKFTTVMPKIMADLMELGQRLAADLVPAMMKELCAENPALAGQLPGCIAKEGEKKSELPRPESPSGSAGTSK